MNKDLNTFIDVYQKEIINESFGTMLKNAGKNLLHKATFGLAGSTKNKSLSDNLKKALEKCHFTIGSGEGDDESFSEAGKVLKTEKSGNFYKVIITNDYSDEGDEVSYGIKVLNVITGKKVKINSNNFKLKTSWNEDEIIKKINSIVAPLNITREDATDEAKAAKEKAKQDGEKAGEEGKKIAQIKEKIEKWEDFINEKASKIKKKEILSALHEKINNISDDIDEKKPFNEILTKYKELRSMIQKFSDSLPADKTVDKSEEKK